MKQLLFGDYTKISEEIGNVDWQSEFMNKGVNRNWENFKQKVHASVNRHVPMGVKKIKCPKAPWRKNKCKGSVRTKYSYS